jgi:hypothetical protein
MLAVGKVCGQLLQCTVALRPAVGSGCSPGSLPKVAYQNAAFWWVALQFVHAAVVAAGCAVCARSCVFSRYSCMHCAFKQVAYLIVAV